jgi:DNA-binding NtrC family response regulator
MLASAGGPPTRGPSGPGGAAVPGRKVLRVDDQVGDGCPCARLLELRGFEVYAAGTAGEALHVLGAWRPEVVVRDLHGSSDPAALARAAGVPVVLVSGSDPAYLAREARRFGAAAALAKPFRCDELAEVLRAVAARAGETAA